MAVELTVTGETADITLTDGDAGNFLSRDDLQTFLGHLRTLERDAPKLVRMMQVGRDFCSGRPKEPPTHATFALLAECLDRWANLPSVTLAAAAGRCHGLGVSLLAQADISIAANSTSLCFPEISADLAPAIVCLWLPERVPQTQTLYWLLTAMEIPVEDAVRFGLVTLSCPDDTLSSVVTDLTRTLESRSAAAMLECKRMVRAALAAHPGFPTAFAVDSMVRQVQQKQAGAVAAK